jgi:hypothetical protein
MSVNALLQKTFRQPLKVDRVPRDAQSLSELVSKRQDPKADIGSRSPLDMLGLHSLLPFRPLAFSCACSGSSTTAAMAPFSPIVCKRQKRTSLT